MAIVDVHALREHLRKAADHVQGEPRDLELATRECRLAWDSLYIIKETYDQLRGECKATAAEVLGFVNSISLGLTHELRLVENTRMKCTDQGAFLAETCNQLGSDTMIAMVRSDGLKISEVRRGSPELFGRFFQNAGGGELEVQRLQKRTPVSKAEYKRVQKRGGK